MRLIRRLLYIAIALVFAGAIAAVSAWWWADRTFHAPGPLAQETTVVVPKGAGLARIAALLAEAGVIPADQPHRLVFTLGVKQSGKAASLHAGEYRFPAGASMQEVLDLLAAGKVVVRALTIAEGLTSPEVLAVLATAEGLDGDLPAEIPPTGTLLPETYHYTLGDSREAMVRRMRDDMRKVLADLWENRAEGLPLKTPEEAVVLASIVEKETGVAAERPRVAAVFLNRLRKGMRLQSDPTVIYGLDPEDGDLGRPLTRADLESDTPYNTYVIAGLPPRPIANPGKAALQAVLDPIESDEYYFVADGTGGHAFARTLDEHNRNVARWRRLQRAAE
ncbi:MAG: endolytic transglycosylase MltG [Caenispirillum sp.]|nr:endolytic transglycosylase MltG [Caenispirillum sp.]